MQVTHLKEYHWDIPEVLIAKVLGGCGVHNAMLYVRATEEDLNRWAVPGWTWEEALEYYKSLENFTGDTAGGLSLRVVEA